MSTPGHARPKTAVILAAGRGTRLEGSHGGGPKGLLAIDGIPLIERSLRLLKEQGIVRILLVVGYQQEAYARFSLHRPELELVANLEYASSSTMSSLALALALIDEDLLLLESDLVYDRRGLSALLEDPRPDLVLASGITSAGDEVWVELEGDLLRGLSKDRAALGSVAGEFVGICKLGRTLAAELGRAHAASGRPSDCYETDALVAAGRRRPLPVLLLPDLIWGEVDDATQLRRVRDEVWPALHAEPLLFTPGPLSTRASVKQAMQVDLGSRDARFLRIVAALRRDLLAVVEADETSHAAIPLQGSGTYALEALLGSILPHEGRLLVVCNGAYGARLAELSRALGLNLVRLELDPLAPIAVARVVEALRADPRISHVAAVHCETSTGLVNPIVALGKAIHAEGRHFLVDAMSSYAGLPLSMPSAHIDFLVSSPNKCLEGVPGFAFVLARRAALGGGRPRGLSLDLIAQLTELERSGQFRYTPPTHALLACARALDELRLEGGVPARFARYQGNQATLLHGMQRLGFVPLLARQYLSPIITAFRCPADPRFDFPRFYDRLGARGYLIYPGKVAGIESFRIGTIGHLVPGQVLGLIDAIERVLEELDLPLPLCCT